MEQASPTSSTNSHPTTTINSWGCVTPWYWNRIWWWRRYGSNRSSWYFSLSLTSNAPFDTATFSGKEKEKIAFVIVIVIESYPGDVYGDDSIIECFSHDSTTHERFFVTGEVHVQAEFDRDWYA
jgi:hypothetical protein